MNAQDQIYSMPTTLGASKLAYGLAMNQPVQIREMVLTDGGGQSFTPVASLETMPNIVHRGLLNSLEPHPDNPRWVIAELVVPAEVGGFTIRGLGLVDADGDLIFVGNHAEQYKPVQAQGSDETKTIRMVVLVSDVAAVTLRTDPSVVLATRAYAQQLAAQGKEYAEGLVEDAATEATQEEAEEGANGTRKMTPRRVFQALRSPPASLIIRPIGSHYVQFAESDGSFSTARSPSTLFGGTWSLRFNDESVFFRTEGTLAADGRADGIQGDAIRNITGSLQLHAAGSSPEGAITRTATGARADGSSGGGTLMGFDASLVVPTASENRVANRLIRVWERTA